MKSICTFCEQFGSRVPTAVVDDDDCFAKLGEYAHCHDSQGLVTRAFRCELGNVAAAKKELEAKESDIRIISLVRTAGGKRHLDFKSAMQKLRRLDMAKEFEFPGPLGTMEWLDSIDHGGGNLVLYDSEWQRSSGVLSSSAASHEHRVICETIRLALSVDQLDVSSLACVENLVRRIIQIELAVQRNPSSPDYKGLGVIVDGNISADGAARAPKFYNWITEQRREQANIMRQDRLYQEEKRHDHAQGRGGGKARGSNDHDGGRGRGRDRGRGGGKDGGRGRRADDGDNDDG